MAEVYSVTNGGVALSASAVKTVVELLTTSASTCRVVGCDLSFDAGTPAQGVKAELLTGAATGTGTAYTARKMNGEAQSRVAVCTAKVNDTVEPASLTLWAGWYIPNASGQLYQLPLGREFYLPPSTLLAVRLTTPAGVTPNAYANLYFEE